MSVFSIICLLILFVLLLLSVINKRLLKSAEKRLLDDTSFKRYHLENNKKNYELCRKILAIAIPVFFISTTLFQSVFFLNEQETQAIVEILGKPSLVNGAGIHWKIPWISDKYKIDTTIQGFSIGYAKDDDGNITVIEDESVMITSDFNFVNVDFYVTYQIADAMEYQYGSEKPEKILKNISQAAIRNIIGSYPVDDVLTTGKSQIQSSIKEVIIEELEEKHIGLRLVNIDMQDAEPPTDEIQKAFKDVEAAKQSANTSINEAEQYSNEKIPAANAEAHKILKDADAQKQERINEALGEVALFNSMYTEYLKNPQSTKLRMYYESMEKLLPNLKVIINGTDDDVTNVLVQNDDKSSENTSKESKK